MTKKEKQPPASLQELQQWFGTLITRPIDAKNHIAPLSPEGAPIEEEAKRYIVPSATLAPHERLEIYNQQYWWRLLNTLHENFPLTTALLGYRDFNRAIGFPSQVEEPPDHWSLNHLGRNLPAWIERNYNGKEAELIKEAAALDWAYIDSFFAKEYSDNTFVEATKEDSSIQSKLLFLQPHLHLFRFNHRLLEFRDLIIDASPDHWAAHPRPDLETEGPYYYAVYRNGSGAIAWAPLTAGAFRLLSQFRTGLTLEESCRWIEKQEPALVEEATLNLHAWFQEWTIRSWIGCP